MTMTLKEVVPFGRSLKEYAHMFSLSEQDLNRKILSAADGPASFNMELKQIGETITSVDPLYCFKADDIEARFHEVKDDVFAQIENSPQNWVWSFHKDLNALKKNRTEVMQRFVSDLEQGLNDRRYLVGELPDLEFENKSFDLALCSHFLFLYSELFSYQFHLDAVLELLRVADEVRIFPLLTLDLKLSLYLNPLMEELERRGYDPRIEKVDYELQKGGNEMLRIGKLSN